jgi:hypothetical protein
MTRVSVLATLGLALGLSSLAAQGRRGLVELPPEGTRRGFWISGGLGYGAQNYRFDGEEWLDQPEERPAFAIRLGGTPDQHLRLGGEVTVWANHRTSDEGFSVTETLSSMTMVGQFYPIRTAGLFFKGGAGLGVSAASVEGGDRVSETGFVGSFGAGYDIPVSRGLAISPTVEMFRHRYTQRGQPTLHERLFLISLSLSFQK